MGHGIVLLVCLLLWHGGAAAQATTGSADDLPVLLEVRLRQHQLAEAIVAWPVQGGTAAGPADLALPLGELARLLTIAIKTDPAAGTASGYLGTPEHAFSLDAASGAVLIDGRREQVDPALLRREADDIYVPVHLLARWLPLALRIDWSALSLDVVPSVRLPLESALARHEQQLRPAQAYRDPGYPRLVLPTAMASAPFIDQSLGFDAVRSAGAASGAVNYSAYATADLLGMQAALFAGARAQHSSGASTPIAGALTRREMVLRLTIGRQDPDANLLGPLHASTALLGNVPVAALDHVSYAATAGNGFLLSNRPPNQSTSFDRHTLEGELAAGWDVELFYNGALAGFQQAGADGRYRFDNLPLAYGANEFRLVFHGPLGQMRVERRSILLEQSALAPGSMVYLAAAQRDDRGHTRVLARLDAGLTRFLSASAAFTRLPEGPSKARDYLSLALHAYVRALIAGLTVVRADSGGRLLEASVKTRVAGMSVSASRAFLADFTSEIYRPANDPVRSRDELRIDAAPGFGALPPPATAPDAESLPAFVLPLALQLRRDTLSSSRQLIDAQLRVAAYVRGTAVSNQLRWQKLDGQRSADGALGLSRRVADYGVSAQLQYGLLPKRALSALSLNADASVGPGALATLGLTRDFSNGLERGRYRLSAGYNRSLGEVAVGVSAFYSSRGEIGVGLRLFTAIGREPRAGLWHASAQPAAATGAASLRAYLDRNGNGRFDGGDTPIANAAFTINGARQNARTGLDGVALLERLPAGAPLDLAIDPDSLADPQWTTAGRGVRLVARAGAVGRIDLAVSISGDIDGSVYQPGAARRPAAGVKVELVGADGAIAASTVTGPDGYYLFPTVLPGAWVVRAGGAERAVVMGEAGDSLPGRDLVLP